jgi:hypothetical protein
MAAFMLGEVIVWGPPSIALAVGVWQFLMRRWIVLAMSLAAAGTTFLGAALIADACLDTGCNEVGAWTLLISWPLSVVLLIVWAIAGIASRRRPRSQHVE